MSYVESILEPGERIAHRAYLHWIIYWRAAALMLVSGLLCYYAGPLVVFGLMLFLVAVCTALAAAIDRWTTEIAVTNQRVILKRGLIRRDTIEINTPKVESVDVRQSILGRFLNFGTVMVRGTGGGLNPLAYVSAPLPLRRAVLLTGQANAAR